MEGVEHRMVFVNGINMHVAEKGHGPVVLLLHGFPELWYSWRHQIISLADHGYRAVAPDLRGYGDTDAPPSFEDYTAFHIVGDLVALIESLGQDQVFVVGHDWGAMMAWYLCLIRPDIVKAMVSLSVPYFRRNPSMKFVEGFRVFCGDDYYICRFQEPGEMEEEFAQVDTPKLMTKFLTIREPDLLMLPKNTWMAGMPKVSVTLPTWLTEEDINYYASKFEKKGFTGGLNYYRAVDLNWELIAAWTNAKVQVPAKFITGDLDLVYHMPGMKDYIHSPEGLKKDVPLLEEIVIMEDVAHFINQEKGDEISKHIYNFIKKF